MENGHDVQVSAWRSHFACCRWSFPSGDNQEPVVIGCMDLGPGGISPAQAHNRSAEIGISIGRAYQDKGYGAEALNWLLDGAFQHAGLHTVQLSTSSYNERAVHLDQKLGFVLEGRRRERFYFRRQWYDDMEFGMTEGDWAQIFAACQSIQCKNGSQNKL